MTTDRHRMKLFDTCIALEVIWFQITISMRSKNMFRVGLESMDKFKNVSSKKRKDEANTHDTNIVTKKLGRTHGP